MTSKVHFHVASYRLPFVTPVTPLLMKVAGDPERPRVLVVDDEESVCAAISSMLSRRGCETVTAGSGPAALARLREEYFDVLVCDIRMPGMSGLECLSEALLLDRDLPVLMLTGMNDIATARNALERGAMDILTKPIELSELERAIRSATRHRRSEIERRTTERLAHDDVISSTETVELRGGPLAGRLVRLEDRRFRLWVMIQPDGQHVLAGMEAPSGLSADARILGTYNFSLANGAMIWTGSADEPHIIRT